MKLYIQNIAIIAGIIVAITASCQWGRTQTFSRIDILEMKLKDETSLANNIQKSGVMVFMEDLKKLNINTAINEQ